MILADRVLDDISERTNRFSRGDITAFVGRRGRTPVILSHTRALLRYTCNVYYMCVCVFFFDTSERI